jgi:hypothetical protein
MQKEEVGLIFFFSIVYLDFLFFSLDFFLIIVFRCVQPITLVKYVTFVVSYLSIGFTEYSVGPEISRSARKLTRTPRIIKKKIHN